MTCLATHVEYLKYESEIEIFEFSDAEEQS